MTGKVGPYPEARAPFANEEVRVFTRRIFDGVLITILAAHLAFGLPRMWARKELVAGSSKSKRLVGEAVLHATS